jgi:hypothetical protein
MKWRMDTPDRHAAIGANTYTVTAYIDLKGRMFWEALAYNGTRRTKVGVFETLADAKQQCEKLEPESVAC